MFYEILMLEDLYLIQIAIFSELLMVLTSTHHTTSFLYVMWCYAQVRSVKRFDTPWGSKPPHLQVGVFKSLQIWSVRRGVTIDLFCSLISATELLLCKVSFPVVSCQSI